MKTTTDYIQFVEGDPKPNTLTWKVITIGIPTKVLGEIAWYGPWRQYAFSPSPNTVFNKDCARQIADFCERQTAAHRLGRPATQQPPAPRPKIVCLCGSTRFTGNMLVRQWELTKLGYIVLSWCALPEGYFPGDGAHGAEKDGVKEAMDELHKRKIDLADEVHVLNLGGYIGQSTRSEIDYALAHGKPLTYEEHDSSEEVAHEIPQTQCPRCHAWLDDLDGFGVLAHEECRYCSHPSRTDGVCGICGDTTGVGHDWAGKP